MTSAALHKSTQVYRVGRKPNPWVPLDWAWASPEDGTFGNRFDDPKSRYRVLYAASQRLGCFVETLARFRVDPTLAAELASIQGVDDFYPVGEVPAAWFGERLMGTATITGHYAEICRADWIARLEKKLLPYFKELGVREFTAATIQTTQPRRLTQLISRVVFEEGYDGIAYPSKYGHDLQNWAIFEPFRIANQTIDQISSNDPDALRALELLNLKVGS